MKSLTRWDLQMTPSVRSLLNENSEARMNQAKATADVLRKLIDEKV